MSGCDSRKRKRELNKEEIRQCIEVFSEVINRRHISNRMPIYDNNRLTNMNHPMKNYNSHKYWYQISSMNGPRLTDNKIINIKPKMISIVGQENDG